MNTLSFAGPAARWGEACPLGNGHLGAMVWGGVETETITLTENTFYSGSNIFPAPPPGAPAAFAAMRRAACAEDYPALHAAARQFIGRRGDYGTNLPVGTLRLRFSDMPQRESLADYQRNLDLMNGLYTCRFSTEAEAFSRTAFLSHPDQIFAMSCHSTLPREIALEFAPYARGGVRCEGDGTVFFWSQAVEPLHCDTPVGVTLAGAIRLETDGQLSPTETGVLVRGATHLRLLAAAATDYTLSGRHKSRPALEKLALQKVLRAMRHNAGQLLRRHETDVRCHMNACTLALAPREEATSVEKTLLGRAELAFQLGRYLLFSSSRKDSRLPAHLQGIWNDNVACRIGWTCDMHLDINTQMNYWPAETTALAETTAPLFRWVAGPLVQNGAQSAKGYYGLPGWAAELVSNAWGYTAPYWAVPLAPYPTGGVWILTHLWQHWLFTGDRNFLETVFYPAAAGAAEFFAAYLFEENGQLSCGPSISPENSFCKNGQHWQLSNGCTYEWTLIRELFLEFVQAARVLGKTRSGLYRKTSALLVRLPTPRLLTDGTLAEWHHDLPSADPQHRHTSHLLGLYPFRQISPRATPAFANGARAVLARKLTPPEGWEDTGWARALLALYQARLLDGDAAWQHLTVSLTTLREPNGFVIHPPTRGAPSFDNVWEMDGNTGVTACMAEMLLQSEPNRLTLLPALPAAWPAGKVRGLTACGGLRVDLDWADACLTRAVLYPARSETLDVFYGKRHCRLELAAGKKTVCTFPAAPDFVRSK